MLEVLPLFNVDIATLDRLEIFLEVHPDVNKPWLFPYPVNTLENNIEEIEPMKIYLIM